MHLTNSAGSAHSWTGLSGQYITDPRIWVFLSQNLPSDRTFSHSRSHQPATWVPALYRHHKTLQSSLFNLSLAKQDGSLGRSISTYSWLSKSAAWADGCACTNGRETRNNWTSSYHFWRMLWRSPKSNLLSRC